MAERKRLIRVKKVVINNPSRQDTKGKFSDVRCYIEAFEDGKLRGWVFDESRPDESLAIKVFASDTLVAEGLADIERGDLIEAGLGNGKHGFLLPFAREALAVGGDYSIRIVLAEEKIEVATNPFNLRIIDPKTQSSEDNGQQENLGAQGYIESFENGKLRGWLFDQNNPNEALIFAAYIDSQKIGHGVADIFREDLKEAGLGNGAHGFIIDLDITDVQAGQSIRIVLENGTNVATNSFHLEITEDSILKRAEKQFPRWLSLLNQPVNCDDSDFPITGCMNAIALLRQDLMQNYNLHTKEGRLAFWAWCMIYGVKEYQILSESITQKNINGLKRTISLPNHDNAPEISALMYGFWLLRPDLQTTFSLNNQDSIFEYFAWFIHYQSGALNGLDAFSEGQVGYLTRSDTSFAPLTPILAAYQYLGYDISVALHVQQDLPAKLNDIMLSIWMKRKDHAWALLFNLNTRRGRLKFAIWCIVEGIKQEPLLKASIDADYLAHFRKPTRHLADADNTGISELMMGIWFLREDLQEAFSLADALSRQAFISWFVKDCEYSVEGLCEPAEWQLPYWPNVSKEQMLLPKVESWLPLLRSNPRIFSKNPASGVNLIGFARGELGIGEDVRMAALACQAVGIPFSIYNIAPGDNVSQKDQRFAEYIHDDLPYSVNIFCLTGFSTMAVFLEQGSAVFRDRYNIGFWPWELPHWPDNWIDAYKLVDEVWASSSYTVEAFKKNATVPVLQMPMAVNLGIIGDYQRKDFHLPENKFLFIFSFDFNSYLARKNPEAPVKAFKQAFPENNQVGLVIKVMHVDQNDSKWQAFRQLIADDPRIILIEQSMRRDQINALYQVCDCFVSLHRSEGFGRGIAEAMLLSKPVIATQFSGNCDFTHSSNAYLVDGARIQLQKDDYPFCKDQFWLDPDIDQASQAMLQVFEERADLAMEKARQAKADIERHYAPNVVGDIYLQRLQKIFH